MSQISPETATLLPCPFCGGTDIQSGTCYVEGIVGVADAVRCAGCGVRGLKDVWNTREPGLAQTPAAGFVLVPIEPTLAQLKAGYEALKLFFPNHAGHIGQYRIYEAMIAASPDTSDRPKSAERCPTCKRTDEGYVLEMLDCRDPWHGDDHLRKRSVTSPDRSSK